MIKGGVTISRARVQLNGLRPYRDRETTRERREKERKGRIHTSEYNMSKIHIANRPSRVDRDEEDFLPRTDFHRRSGRPIGKENLWITRGPRAEIEPRQSVARAPLVDPRVAISQIDPGHERNLFLSSTRDPRSLPPSSSSLSLCLSFSTFVRSRAREINSRFNYHDIANFLSLFFSNRRPRRIAM